MTDDGKTRQQLIEELEAMRHRVASLETDAGEALYRNIIETTAAVAWEVSLAAQVFTYISPQISALSGYGPLEWTDFDSWERRIHDDDRERVVAYCRAETQKGLDHALEYRMVSADGRTFWIRDVVSVIKEQDRPVALRGYFVDITERRRAEEDLRKLELQVRHSQRLESLGILAGGIAHDFNNILTGLLGNADLALWDLPKHSALRPLLEDIQQAGRRAAELTGQMLAYSGKGKFVVEDVDISALVHDMKSLLESATTKKVGLSYELAADLPAVRADATQLRQIVLNLVGNAFEAIGGESGVVALSTYVTDGDSASLELVDEPWPLAAGPYATIEVTDSGCGMDEETRAKVFEPYFSTKFTGRGLGLAAVQGIVRGHHGAIIIESIPGKGTTFKVLLPASGRTVEAIEARATEPESDWQSSGTILVVDDEAMVRRVVVRILKRAGFRVLTAEDGIEAVALFRELHAEIDGVLLDLKMPRLDGEETFIELRKIKHDVRVILSSGYSEHESTKRWGDKGLAGFLQKPYQIASLRQKLRECFGQMSDAADEQAT